MNLVILMIFVPHSRADISGDLMVFHAGSLSVPFKEVARAFKKEYPGVRVTLEAAGSRASARKISDLNREADVFGSADYTVIDALLIPDHASWTIRFAANEMVLAYTEHSRYAREISNDNWYEILKKNDVAYGRADPNSDPCGYRTVLTSKLAEQHYGQSGLSKQILDKDRRHIRPKETDLIALLEVGEIDYIFIYRSVASQHGLKWVTLPDEINLKNPAMAGIYESVNVEISGKKPGSTITKPGAPMVYGVTIPTKVTNPEAAVVFVEFLLENSKGIAIMERNGQPSLVPSFSDTYDNIPAELQKFARKQ
ncbi:MAG: tungstate ABC transporter substrate-binding protein WtpA [Pseudomonadales bacterium]|nr:tungstate ABC transporter substrate-binding protein WtpA [Gammaproteobacteria bacterium]MDP6028040.1 tungstate ABC transporter substrate-binding protein WtpA [Pseudomonadales bacterium]MDP6316191.1 tungstate ABC transporter substrate-binding protein WtpA [Pseudomonadales bacterium]MDP7316172.1 tungstate ABC transporter substrate-binding protein WtpA [Pseudomonadales bacterium]